MLFLRVGSRVDAYEAEGSSQEWIKECGNVRALTTYEGGIGRGNSVWERVIQLSCSKCSLTSYPEAPGTCIECLLQPSKYFFCLFDHIIYVFEIVLPSISLTASQKPLMVSHEYLNPFFSFSFCSVVFINRFEFYEPQRSESLKELKKIVLINRKHC